MSSWISIEENPQFSLQNLPYGIFSTLSDLNHRIGVAIGNYVLDMSVLTRKGVFESLNFDTSSLQQTTLNRYAGLGKATHNGVRHLVQDLLSADTASGEILRDNLHLRALALVPMTDAEMHLPMTIGDYSDFFTSPFHAQNVGSVQFP